MAFKSKREVKKKKGPKGKRARAKAKLERQWNETVDESQVKGLRRGKSRLLPDHGKAPSRKERSTHNNDSDEEMNVHVSSEESDADEDEGMLNVLLKSINKKSRRSSSRQPERMPADNDSASSEDESSSEMSLEDRNDLVEESEDNMSDDDGADGDENDDMPFDIDPFSSHFNREPLDEKELSQAVSVSQKTVKVSLPNLGSSLELQLNEGSATDEATSLFRCNRKVLRQTWRKVNGSVLRSSKKNTSLSALQAALYPSLATYKDTFIAAETRENRDEIHNILALHLLNHVLTSRGRIQRNNKKVKDSQDDVDVEVPRDQGFTRPTVLVLLPTRGTCYSFVKTLLELLGNPARVDNLDRFDTEYGPLEIDDDDEDEKQRKRRKAVMEAKGSDWQELFGEATNSDDDFKIGVSVTPKTASKGDGGVSVKLYTDFYRSDIIIASPLGLKMSLDNKDDDTPDTDFLSSIEICLVAHASVLLMQNWDHVNGVLTCLNQQPKKNNDTDFARVRNYLLSGQAENWRQLILISSLSDPYIVSTFKRHAKSIAGRLKLRRRTPAEDASLCNVLVRVKQVFQRISCNSLADQGSDKLRFFEQRILPQIRKQKHTMVFIPSYFDFVSVRNMLLKKEIEFVSVTEYARVSEVARGRARFLQGIKALMLYTGRAHFFQRHAIKGVRHLILYGIPEHGEFYSELVNNLNAGLEREETMEDLDLASPLSCLSLFTKYDALALERIVGNEHCQRMMKGEKSTFMFRS